MASASQWRWDWRPASRFKWEWPAEGFLVEFEDLLCQTFADLAQRAVRTQRISGLIVLWMRTLPDLISPAFGQRLRSDADWRFRLRWFLACTAGAVAGMVCVSGYSVSSIGIFQALLLTRKTWRGVLWIPASTAGILGCAAIFTITRFGMFGVPLAFYLLNGLNPGNELRSSHGAPAAMDSKG